MITAAAGQQPGATSAPIEPLTYFARVAQAAIPPDAMASLSLQLASAASQLGTYLHIRGDEGIEHYYGAALTLACLEPVQSDVQPYEALLQAFMRFDRRAPNLPLFVPAGNVRVQKQRSVHFIQLLRDQRAFQAVYQAARQIDTYGVRSQSARKLDRVVLLSREMAGSPLLAPLGAAEQLYLRLAM